MYRIAIVGRPNVGKSTLFNRLIKTRKAIVGDEPGITRDRLSEVVLRYGKSFEIIDTGGFIPEEKEAMPRKILEQAKVAMQEANLLVFVTDAREGILPMDETLNALLRAHGKEYLLVVNKVDIPRLEESALQFYALGVDHIYPVSAEHNQGISTLLEAIIQRIPGTATSLEREEIRVAIIGRPNVGKSSLLNRLLGEERAIVTDLPGTTRDAIDSHLQFEDQSYCLIDTAGIRRKGKTRLKTEKLSVIMARKNLEKADVALLVVDVVEGLTKLDATIGGYAHEAGKSIIVVVNKWDLMARDTHTAALTEKEFRTHMKFLDYSPIVFVSAKTGQRVTNVLNFVKKAFEARQFRVSTAELNKFLEKKVSPDVVSVGKQQKFPVKYAVQVSVEPPTFVFFTRSSSKLHFSRQRFFVNRLREEYGFYATPIRVLQRKRKSSQRD